MKGISLSNRIHSIRQKVERYLYDPNLTRQEAMVKEILFYWTFFTFLGNLGSLVLTTILDAYPMIVFSYTMTGMLIFIMILYGTRLNFRFYAVGGLYAAILMSLIFSGWMGGPMDSGGLIYIGVYCIVVSSPFRDMKVTLKLTAFYIISLAILVLLDPYLDVHPGMTPRNNYIMFLVKLTWLTTAQVVLLVYYFKESNRYEERENKRLEELDNTKNRLFTNISHEFRTPITLILGSADQIPPDERNTGKALGTIRSNGKRLLRLVNQMLSLAKLESGKIELNNVQSDIIRFIEFIVHTFQSLAESKHIRLEFDTYLDSCFMDFDPEKIEEITTNLISNALRYTHAGGKVTVEIHQLAESDGREQQCIRIVVRDNGIGIPADKLDRIFDRFYQVDMPSKQYQEGSGIGLTLVRENIKLIGGSVEVSSTEGIGTTFQITLPVHREAPVQTGLNLNLTEMYPDTPGDRHRKPEYSIFHKVQNGNLPLLLVVEDHEGMIDYIRSLLEGEYRVITANNGSEGINTAIKFIPDIIISDVMMPEMDGFEMLEKLKQDIHTSHIPVIMLTAKADMPSKLEGLETGAEAYLAKPFDKQELKIRLKSILAQRAKLQKRYLTSILLDTIPDLNKTETVFKQQLNEILLANLDNPQFKIDTMVREIGMSRTQLYKKVKALTNTSVDKYVRKFRLHQAVHLLKSTDLSVSQVALEVGMPNQSYFSRAFREEFGHSPSEVAATS